MKTRPLAQLIEAKALEKQLDDDNLIIFDCRFSLDKPEYGQQAYQQGHIPHAQFLDLEKDLANPVIKGVTSRHPLPDPDKLAGLLAQCGLNQTSKIVIYDDGAAAYATKLWWTLIWLGRQENIFILNGGYQAWLAEDLPVSQHAEKRAVGDFKAQVDTTLLVSANRLLAQLDDPALSLFDARSLPRFKGEVEPMDPVAGHIPRAQCANYTENFAADGRFLPVDKLKQRFSHLIGTRPASHIIAYCGSGVSATANIFALCLAGYPLVRLYAGSWSEWITDPSRPIAKGD